MTEWQGYNLAEFPELGDPEDTIREALRDTIGDGEGIDDAVMRKFKSKIKADALREAAEAARSEEPGEPHAGATFVSHACWLDERANRIEEEA